MLVAALLGCTCPSCVLPAAARAQRPVLLLLRQALQHPSLLILQVVVEGWKSYKDQTVLEPFSPKVNVIGEQVPSGGTAPIASTPALRTHPLCRLACSELAAPHRTSAVDFWVCPTFRVGQQAGPGRCQACAQLAATLLHLHVLPAVGANGSGKSNFFHGETLLLLQFDS